VEKKTSKLFEMSLQLLRIILRDKAGTDLDGFIRLEQLLTNLTHLSSAEQSSVEKKGWQKNK
jgi:hypothetical protein